MPTNNVNDTENEGDDVMWRITERATDKVIVKWQLAGNGEVCRAEYMTNSCTSFPTDNGNAKWS